MPAFDDDVWELYDGSSDWTQANDLAKERPEKLHELQRLWLVEAVKYNVLPLDDRQIERLIPEMAGRPTLIKGNSQLLFSGMGRLSENSVVSIKNKSFAITADLDASDKAANGVFIAQGGRFGGWSLYARDGKAKFVYNVLGIKEYSVESSELIPSGKTQVRLAFAYDGGGPGRGGIAKLYFGGKAVGEGRVDQTQGFVFSADGTTDIGLRVRDQRPAPTTRRTPAASTARSTGSRSTLARMPETPTTSSRGGALPHRNGPPVVLILAIGRQGWAPQPTGHRGSAHFDE